MSKFSKLFAKYKTYDESEGRGNAEEWRSAYNEKISSSQARGILKKENPLIVLGFVSMPSLQELKNKFNKLMMKHHPDKGGDHVRCKKIIAAYVLLEEQLL